MKKGVQGEKVLDPKEAAVRAEVTEVVKTTMKAVEAQWKKSEEAR